MQTSAAAESASDRASALGRALLAYGAARRLADAEARRGLSLNELDARALLFIVENPGARPSHIRDHLGITSAGVTTLIDRLVQRGAVRRDLDADDRRVNHITATVDLSAPPWSAIHGFDSAVEAAIAAIDPADADRLAAVLERLTAAASPVAPR